MVLKASASSRISGGDGMFSGSPKSPRATAFVFSRRREMGMLTDCVLITEMTITIMTATMSDIRIAFAVRTEIASIRTSFSSRSAEATLASSRRRCAASEAICSRSARKRMISRSGTLRAPVGPAVSSKSLP